MTHIYTKFKSFNEGRKGKSKWFIDIVEFLLAIISLPISFFLINKFTGIELAVSNFHLVIFTLMISFSWFVFSKVTLLAKIPRTQRYLTILFEMSRVTFLTALILLIGKYMLFLKTLPPAVIFAYVTILFLFISSFRYVAFKALKFYRAKGHSLHRVLIIADMFSDNIIEKLQDQKEWGFNIVGIMSNSRMIREKYADNVQIYSESENLKTILDSNIIDEVIFCKKSVNNIVTRRIADLCSETGVLFRLQSTVSPLDPVYFQLKTITKDEEFALIDAPSNSISHIIKNMGDIYFSLLAVILLFPLFLLLALIIRIDSQGPVFFKQERIGLRGRKFKLYKFRTMVTNAEALLEKLQEKNEADGPVFKMKHDPRITRVGRFLRKTGIDELPQLINVLKGEMSLIGPRPPLENEVKKYKRWQLKRLSVKPGITCTWQVVPNRHDVSFEEWMKLDMGYINNWNIMKDVQLLFKTFRTFISAGGH